MRRFGVLVVAAAVAAGPTAGIASAAPGTGFPEQPGGHVATACTSILSNPGTGVDGASRLAPIAADITTALLTDACFGG